MMKHLFFLLLAAPALAPGADVEFFWEANAEGDVVAYEIGIGNEPGNYDRKILIEDPVFFLDETTGVRKVKYPIQLDDGKPWFAAVRAITDQGFPSAYSNEINFGVPAAPQGFTFKLTIELVPLSAENG